MPWNFFDRYGQKRVNSGMAMTSQEVAIVAGTGAVNVAATAAPGTLVVTFPSFTADGISAYEIQLNPTIIKRGTSWIWVSLYDNGTLIARIAYLDATYSPGPMKYRVVPTSGAHVFTVRAWVDAGAGTWVDGGGLDLTTTHRIIRADWAVYNPGAVPKITTSPLSGGPPANPQDNDIWIATGVDTLGSRWQFQYDLAEATAYKWKFIGGPVVTVYPTTFTSPSGGAWNPQNIVAVARAGTYSVTASARMSGAATGLYISFTGSTLAGVGATPDFGGMIADQLTYAAGAQVILSHWGAVGATFQFQVVTVQPVRIA
jgi:hypothetical protein